MKAIPSKKCICCASEDLKPHLGDLLRCSSCGHIVADLDLDKLDFKEIYSIDYFEQGEYLDYIKDKACFEKNFKKRLDRIRHFQPAGRLLEIGSASGFFLNLASRHYEVAGYEICEDMANYAKKEFGLDIKSMDFLQDSTPKGHYDAVVMWDCIEHLAHPEDFLTKINSVLKPKGLVALTTGDIGSFMANLQGRKWRLIHPPTHLHYFTKDSMTVFLKNRGFEVISVEYPGFYRSIRQMFYGSFVKKNEQPLVGAREPFWKTIPIYLNLYDIMLVIARKI